MITVSGISSGGYMASQVHVALSSLISGCGIFAAGPYACALGSVERAEQICMSEYSLNNLLPNANELAQITRSWADINLIDQPINLAKSQVYIYSGSLDTIIGTPIVQTSEQFYSHWINLKNIKTEYFVQAEHSFPTLNFGSPCSYLGSPYINSCGFDGAGQVLSHLLINKINLTSPKSLVANNLKPFDQSIWTENLALSSLADTGWIYLPTGCDKSCPVHITFHGCKQGIEWIGQDWILYSGFNQWAEANSIIIIYPYIKTTQFNPNGCWDWWGYTGINYANKYGLQVQFIHNLIKHIDKLIDGFGIE